jgi:hypothetical protein
MAQSVIAITRRGRRAFFCRPAPLFIGGKNPYEIHGGRSDHSLFGLSEMVFSVRT